MDTGEGKFEPINEEVKDKLFEKYPFEEAF